MSRSCAARWSRQTRPTLCASCSACASTRRSSVVSRGSSRRGASRIRAPGGTTPGRQYRPSKNAAPGLEPRSFSPPRRYALPRLDVFSRHALPLTGPRAFALGEQLAVKHLDVRRVELLYDAVQRNAALAALLDVNGAERFRPFPRLDDLLNPTAYRMQVVQVLLKASVDLSAQNDLAVPLYNALVIPAAQRLEAVYRVLPASIGEERHRHHGIRRKQDVFALDLAHNGVRAVPRHVPHLERHTAEVQVHHPLVEHDFRQADLDGGQLARGALRRLEALPPRPVEQFTREAVADDLRVLEQARAVRVIGVVVGVHHVLDRQAVTPLDELDDLLRFNGERQRVDHDDAFRRQDRACCDLRIQFTGKDEYIGCNKFAEHKKTIQSVDFWWCVRDSSASGPSLPGDGRIENSTSVRRLAKINPGRWKRKNLRARCPEVTILRKRYLPCGAVLRRRGPLS